MRPTNILNCHLSLTGYTIHIREDFSQLVLATPLMCPETNHPSVPILKEICQQKSSQPFIILRHKPHSYRIIMFLVLHPPNRSTIIFRYHPPPKSILLFPNLQIHFPKRALSNTLRSSTSSLPHSFGDVTTCQFTR